MERKYYDTKREAIDNKKKSEMLYYDAFKERYYTVKLKINRKFWERLLIIKMKKLNEKYDAYYDDEKDIWLEEKCDNPNCEFCKNRPTKPSECKS